MRARLLDMGEVSAARSQSIYHAVAATMGPEDSPVAIVSRPASGLISIGIDRDPATEIDLEMCLEQRIPVLRRLLGGPAEVVADNRLLLSFLIPEGGDTTLRDLTPAPIVNACRVLGLESSSGPSGEILVGGEDNQPSQVGMSQTGSLGKSLCMVASMARDPEPLERASLLLLHRGTEAGGYHLTSLAKELEKRPDFATIAEGLVASIEDNLEVELVPSMPTPDEMDAIYEWDERLVFDLEAAIEAANDHTDQLAC